MKKTRSRKSRDTVPLSFHAEIFKKIYAAKGRKKIGSAVCKSETSHICGGSANIKKNLSLQNCNLRNLRVFSDRPPFVNQNGKICVANLIVYCTVVPFCVNRVLDIPKILYLLDWQDPSIMIVKSAQLAAVGAEPIPSRGTPYIHSLLSPTPPHVYSGQNQLPLYSGKSPQTFSFYFINYTKAITSSFCELT